MSPNRHVEERLKGIQQQLIAGYNAGGSVSSATKGAERQNFVENFLSQVLPTHFRFGTGDVTDKDGRKSGQMDVVIEFPFGPSLPIVGGNTTRLYLAETVAAVIEVKSDAGKQWDEAVSTAKSLFPLVRSYGATIKTGLDLPKIPVFIVGFVGWKRMETVEEKVNENQEVSGILVVDPGLFVSSKALGGIKAPGPWALWGLIASLHRATSFLRIAQTDPLKYAL